MDAKERVREITEAVLSGSGFDPCGGSMTHDLTEAILSFLEYYDGIPMEANPLRHGVDLNGVPYGKGKR